MGDLSLENLHLAARYRKNVNSLVDGIYSVYNSLRNFASVAELQHFCGELFEKIKRESVDTSGYLDGTKQLTELLDKTSFSQVLSETNINKKTLELADFIAFKIIDFAYVFGNERAKSSDEKQFSEWNFRAFQLLFKQKGQLWLLNCLYNILEFEKQTDKIPTEIELKEAIRSSIDKDFSPYPKGLTDIEVDRKIAEIRELADTKEEFGKFNTSVKRQDRSMGFEVEHQVPYAIAEEIDLGENGELHMLETAGSLYHDSKYNTLREVVVGVSVASLDVIKHGSLTRDPSNARYPGYIACEYSSPVKNLEGLIQNAQELCSLLNELGGGIVRQDCGTHVHVSIEDLKDNPSDSEELKKQKLEALKRILRNFIILRDDFESILPEYRRGDNSVYSGQAYATFVDDDKKFILGLINSCKSYNELKSVLMVGGKYLSLAPFNNTIEFRSFPATTNSEVLSNWFQLLNEFVNNSIHGVALENCLNREILEKLQILTNHGEEISGLQPNDSENICFKCNSCDYSKFRVIESPVVKAKKIAESMETESRTIFPISKIQLYRNIAEYVNKVARCINRLHYAIIPDLSDCSVAMGITRRHGEIIKSPIAPIYRQIFESSQEKRLVLYRGSQENKNDGQIKL